MGGTAPGPAPVPAATAVSPISSGERVFIGSGAAEPVTLVRGQLDFIRGAARSRRGRPIIALPSTAADGSVSRIVPTLRPGAGVVTSRGDVHLVVTEYGVADLYAKGEHERARALIAIAHPDWRERLAEQAARLLLTGRRVP